jgi:hypothetical protein
MLLRHADANATCKHQQFQYLGLTCWLVRFRVSMPSHLRFNCGASRFAVIQPCTSVLTSLTILNNFAFPDTISGWWHVVLNLSSSVAITHNFLSRHGLSSHPKTVWRELCHFQPSFAPLWFRQLRKFEPLLAKRVFLLFCCYLTNRKRRERL